MDIFKLKFREKSYDWKSLKRFSDELCASQKDKFVLVFFLLSKLYLLFVTTLQHCYEHEDWVSYVKL